MHEKTLTKSIKPFVSHCRGKSSSAMLCHDKASTWPTPRGGISGGVKRIATSPEPPPPRRSDGARHLDGRVWRIKETTLEPVASKLKLVSSSGSATRSGSSSLATLMCADLRDYKSFLKGFSINFCGYLFLFLSFFFFPFFFFFYSLAARSFIRSPANESCKSREREKVKFRFSFFFF